MRVPTVALGTQREGADAGRCCSGARVFGRGLRRVALLGVEGGLAGSTTPKRALPTEYPWCTPRPGGAECRPGSRAAGLRAQVLLSGFGIGAGDALRAQRGGARERGATASSRWTTWGRGSRGRCGTPRRAAKWTARAFSGVSARPPTTRSAARRSRTCPRGAHEPTPPTARCAAVRAAPRVLRRNVFGCKARNVGAVIRTAAHARARQVLVHAVGGTGSCSSSRFVTVCH